MRQHPPLRTSSHEPSQPVKHFAQIVLTLGRFFRHQSQVRSRHLSILHRSHRWGMIFCSYTRRVPKVSEEWERKQTVLFGFLFTPVIRQKSRTDSRRTVEIKQVWIR